MNKEKLRDMLTMKTLAKEKTRRARMEVIGNWSEFLINRFIEQNNREPTFEELMPMSDLMLSIINEVLK